jgi:histidyl-tRNA synthetase
MASQEKVNRPKARVAKGFRDIPADEIRGVRTMLATIQRVYESYGFEPVEQPFVEYTDALGKFLPDQDRPNAGVFSFQDDDDQWLSLRYDLTAPLARYVAENQQFLPTPYRSYRQGWVFRNEKPGPGRFRQFMQFDADTVGSASPAADAEVCMMAADTMEALGLKGQYVLKVNNRKLLDGAMEAVGLAGNQNAAQRIATFRAIDKLDRLGWRAVIQLLGKGRKDDSGDFTKGAELSDDQIIGLMYLYLPETQLRQIKESGKISENINRISEWDEGKFGIIYGLPDNALTIEAIERNLPDNELSKQGLAELKQMQEIFTVAQYDQGRVVVDPRVVRGLEYYTGPVFECELLIETKDEDGRPVRFGSVGGGGRYDDLVARFTGQQVPATGFSIGVSRLYAALKLVGKAQESSTLAPVVVLVMDKDRQGDYWQMVQKLRNAKDENGKPSPIRAEMYVGTAGMKAQMKYADKRGAPLVVIQGGDEKAKGEVQIKNLRQGKELASGIESREEYASQRLAQVSVKEAELVAAVQTMLKR